MKMTFFVLIILSFVFLLASLAVNFASGPAATEQAHRRTVFVSRIFSVVSFVFMGAVIVMASLQQ